MDSPSSPDYASSSFSTPYELLFRAISLIPLSHFLFGFLLIFLTFLYNILEIHLLHHLLTGFRGDRVSLTYNSASDLYQRVASKCRILHGRYSETPWLSSSHLQTAFLSIFGRPPTLSYKRQLFNTSDGGTIALDWLMNYDVTGGATNVNISTSKDDKTPIVIVIPGLTSDSSSAYIKHLALKMAKHGWNVVVSNHRGLGGISITSDCFYNAGWTEDIRRVVGQLHYQYPEAPLFLVGTSIGANVLVKYLGEDGIDIPIIGAAAVCSPWDLLICDRFINRRRVQKFYDRALTIGLQGYARLHQSIFCRLANWEGIEKSSSVRDFDHHATRVLGNYETVDSYYRHSSSVGFLAKVAVPLLCISALDDPVCTKEAIPWDECRANKNIILATTVHGGHLAYFEGINASIIWWVRAVEEFFDVLHSSQFLRQRIQILKSTAPSSSTESSIDQGPYVNVSKDGMVSAIVDVQTDDSVKEIPDEHINDVTTEEQVIIDTGRTGKLTNVETQKVEKKDINMTAPVRRCINQLSRRSGKSIWLLAYIAIVTTWPLVGPALLLLFKRKLKIFLPAALLKR